MSSQRYSAQDLIDFGSAVLQKVGFHKAQAEACAWVLVQADLRNDMAHGITGPQGLYRIMIAVAKPEPREEFRTIVPARYTIDAEKYPTVISVDGHGALGHYTAKDIIPALVARAQKYGYAKAYIRNSTHFGDCGIFSELIAQHDLAARVTCVSPQWMRPFIELQDGDEQSPANLSRYKGVSKRFGTNPIAWTIPHEGGMITIDMAATQRALSPVSDAAQYNARALGLKPDEEGLLCLYLDGGKIRLSEFHLQVAGSKNPAEVLKQLGLADPPALRSVERGLISGPSGEEILYPLSFDAVFKNHFYIDPLGGTYFGYKGFGLNMLIELDNVLGGGTPEVIRKLDAGGRQTTDERISQTLEAYAIDAVYPLAEAKARLARSVRATAEAGNKMMFLPGQKEQDSTIRRREKGVPLSPARVGLLKSCARHPAVDIPFSLEPMG